MTTPRSSLFRASAVAALVLSCFSVSDAQTETDSTHPTPASVTTVGTLRVERYGSGSPAIVFIPGLSCGSWVWDDAVNTYGGTHALYLVTLAGFDGLPAPSGPALDRADASLLALIASEKLDRPIVVGHSLGGHLAIRFGEEHAALVRGIVSVDGTPVFPTLAQSSAADRAAAAKNFSDQIAGATPAQYLAGQLQSIGSMVSDPARVAHIAGLSARSDAKAVAAYANDLLLDDIRPQLSQLTVPTLEIAPVPTQPAAYEGPNAASQPMADRAAGYKSFYASLFPGAPKLTIVTIPNSKHFVMVDQPKAMYEAISAFIGTLPS